VNVEEAAVTPAHASLLDKTELFITAFFIIQLEENCQVFRKLNISDNVFRKIVSNIST
jgi:hypothetical protein